MSRQSYKIHLELIHGDTSGNLREHGVKDISSMFVRREPEKVVEEEEPDISEGSRERSRSPIRRSRSKSTSSSDERVQELEEKFQKLMEKQEWIEDIMDVIGNKVDTMALKAGINVNVNDCKNNGYKILLKQVVALENVLEVKQSVERLDQCLKELKLTCEPPKLVDEVKYEVGDVFRKCRSIKDIENKFAEFEYNETGEQIDWVVCNKKVNLQFFR